MAVSQTDQEQIDMIKQWWKDYGKTLAIAIIVGLALGFGWRYWREHRIETAEKASAVYQQMAQAAGQKELQAAQSYATDLIKQYPGTPYASLAAFFSARQAVEANKLKEAVQQLKWVVSHGKVASFRQIARLRAARVLLAQGQAQAALDLLNTVDDQSFKPMIESVKGDIYAALGNAEAAKSAYRQAKTGFAAVGVNDPFLTMKLAQPIGQLAATPHSTE